VLLLDTVREAVQQGSEAPTSGAKNLETLRLLFGVTAAGEASAAVTAPTAAAERPNGEPPRSGTG
jgi:hypothetical protein